MQDYQDYLAFGGCLRSELPFPELPASGRATADWTLRRGKLLPRCDGRLLGKVNVEESVDVSLFRDPHGVRFVFDDTGAFAISADGSAIVWDAPPGSSEQAAALDVLGRVLPMCMHLQGIFCLHGSAVAFPLGGVAFVAPKFHGKSTLARALVGSGALLASDDTVPVLAAAQVSMYPGVHQLRLWSDSAARFTDDDASRRDGYGGKSVLADLPPERLLHEAIEMRAIYLLAPRPADAMPDALRRVRLSGTQAALGLVVHAKLGSLLGGPEAPAVLDLATRIVAAVPTYRLEIARDFGRLDRVVEKLWSWHQVQTDAVLEAEPVPL